MASFKTGFRSITVLLVLLGCGCSWFSRRDEPAPATPAPVTATEGAVDLGLRPAALTPDAQALRAAATLATDFYDMRQRLGRHGLPNAGDMKAYRAFLCPSLADALEAARQRQAAYIAEHPDDKPPLVDADLFSSLFEGPEVVIAGSTELDGEGARVLMQMRAGEGDSAVRWKDDVLLQRQDGIWCIADVEYGGDWPFAHKGRLSEMLAAPF